MAGLLLVAAACGGSDGGGDTGSAGSTDPTGATTGATGATGPRPASTATVTIVSPRNGAVVHDTSVHVEVELDGGTIVPQTTKDVQPDEGHLHVYLDDALISMTEGTEQDVEDLSAGVHRLQVEFVAADHVPFDPRVIEVVTFDVRP